MEGRVIKSISDQFTVCANEKEYVCKASKKLEKIVTGDFVVFDEKQNYITKILPRKNSLIRPSISNVDNALIVTSVHIPAFSSNLLDKLLCIIQFNNIRPIICFTKMDKLADEKRLEIKKVISYYKKQGFLVFENTEISLIKKVLEEKVTVLTGQTGAGKSTLINKLDSKFNLQTGEVSTSLGRGKHTTRYTRLLNINNGLVADTPGFSSASFYGMTKEDIRDSFLEFNKYKNFCKYKDCMHIKEDDCYIKKLVAEKVILESRYMNYINFIKEGVK